jgi:hypothetical protein
MSFFYFNTSAHPAPGFVLGAWVACESDPTGRLGPKPGAAARPDLDGAEEHYEVVRESNVGIVIAPAGRDDDVASEALRGLRTILQSNGLGTSGHAIFLDRTLAGSRPRIDSVMTELDLTPGLVESLKDSTEVPGLHMARLVADACAVMLLEQLGHESGGDIDVASMWWAGVRWQLFGAPLPAPHEWASSEDWRTRVEARALVVADACSNDVRRNVLDGFGRMYLEAHR